MEDKKLWKKKILIESVLKQNVSISFCDIKFSFWIRTEVSWDDYGAQYSYFFRTYKVDNGNLKIFNFRFYENIT